ncbi:MAG TPA: glycoside hydrolase family 5 protein [Chitinophagaceae bacterium]
MRFVFSILFLMTLSFRTDSQIVRLHGQLKVKGAKLVDVKGNDVLLHGMSFGWHNWWPRFYNADVVHELATKWKCTVIRAAMGIEPDSGYLKNRRRSLELITNVVDACIKEDVYVIIDWHDHNIHEKEAVEFFSSFSKKYASYPHIIYEILNEPDHESWADIKAYSEAVIKAIRANDPDNIILVGSPHWSQDVHIAAADPIRGYDNLMYTMHFYAGTHKQWLRDRTSAAIKKGLPVFVSECAGMEASGNGPLDNNEWKAFVEWMNENKLSWIGWSVSDKKETCSVLETSAASGGDWKEENIKEWGKLVKSYLTGYEN